jgi:hypothetical protein
MAAHKTPIGLTTYGDAGTDTLSPPLAAECESGLDFTPILTGMFAAVFNHVVALNSQRAVPARWLSASVGIRRPKDGAGKRQRADQINEYCWDKNQLLF